MKVIVKSRLKTVRMRKNITVRELASLSNISKNNISNIENNKTVPTIYTICVLAVALGVEPEELYFYEVVPS